MVFSYAVGTLGPAWELELNARLGSLLPFTDYEHAHLPLAAGLAMLRGSWGNWGGQDVTAIAKSYLKSLGLPPLS